MRMMVLFGSTNIFWQTFSTANINKSKHMSPLTDGNLHFLLRTSNSNTESDIKQILKDKLQCHVSH